MGQEKFFTSCFISVKTMELHSTIRQLLAKCLVTTVIFNFAIVANKVTSQLTIIPQWNVTANQTGEDSCSLGTDDNQEDVVILAGSPIQSCSVQLMITNGTAALIQIPEDTLMYAERKGKLLDCQKKYVSFAANEPCVFLSRHPNLQIYLQGNILNESSIIIRHMPIGTPVPFCQDASNNEQQYAFTVSQTKHCQIDEFNHVTFGDVSFGYTCSFIFPVNCDITLGKQNVEFQCNEWNLSGHQSLIVYPTNCIKLDLIQRSIINIHRDSFAHLKTLNELYIFG